MTGHAPSPPVADRSSPPRSPIAERDTTGDAQHSSQQEPPLPDPTLGERPRPRNQGVDAACVVLTLVLDLGLVTTESRPSGGPVAGLAVCLASAALLWWRHRWPVHLGLLLGVLDMFFGTASVAVLVMVYTVAACLRLRPALLLGGAVLVMYTIGSGMLWPVEGYAWWIDPLIELALITSMVTAGVAVRAQRRTTRERELRAERDREQRIERARQLERTRIAGQMHDALTHRLSQLSVHADTLTCRADASPEQTAAAAGMIRASAHQALRELREVIWLLRWDVPAEEAPAPRPTSPPSPSPSPASANPPPTLCPDPTLYPTSASDWPAGR